MRLLLIFALLGLLSSCRPPENAAANRTGTVTGEDVTVSVEVEGEPVVGPAPVRVRVEENGTGVAGAAVEVVGDMTHAGMVPVVAQARQVEPGVYLADDFAFSMAGDWVISAEVSLADGERIRAARALSVRQQ